MNGDSHCEANGKTVKHHCPGQKTGVILERQDGTVHDQVGRDRQSDEPQRANAPIPEAVSEPRQEKPDKRQNQPEEAYLFDHVRHDHEQTDAANDHQREAIKQLTRRTRALPQHRADGAHEQRERRSQQQHQRQGVAPLALDAAMIRSHLTC